MPKKKFYMDLRVQCYVPNHEELMPEIAEQLRSGEAEVECLHYGGDRYVIKIKGSYDAQS